MGFRKFLLMIFALIGGPIMLIGGIGDVLRSHATESWVAVEGDLLSAEVESRQQRRRFRKATRWYPKVRYSYVVDGTRYESTQVTRQSGKGRSSKQSETERYVRSLRSAEQLEVWYDPDHPEEAVLIPGLVARDWGRAGLGSFLVLIAVALLVSIMKAAGRGEMVEF